MNKVNIKRLNELLQKARQKKKPKSPSKAKNKSIKGIPQPRPMTSSKRLSIRNHIH